MHSNSLGCPRIFSLSAPVLYWLSHLTCISSLKAKNERKTLIFTQLKTSRYNQQLFPIFKRILRHWPPAYLVSSDQSTNRSTNKCHNLSQRSERSSKAVSKSRICQNVASRVQTLLLHRLGTKGRRPITPSLQEKKKKKKRNDFWGYCYSRDTSTQHSSTV